MRFTTFIARNLLFRRARTALTVLGLAVAIAAVMVLTGVAWGFERSFLAIYQSKAIDLVVVRAGISDQLSSNLDANLGEKLKTFDGVAEVAPTLMDTVSFEDANLVSVLANGWPPGTILYRGVRILAGRPLREDDRRAAMLGRVLALNLGKTVGDEVSIAGEVFRVVATFESESIFENGGLVVPLDVLQAMMGREGQVTAFLIATKSTDGDAVAGLGRAIEKAIPGVAAVPARDYVRGNVQIRLAKSMAWATTAVALVLGSVGMLNTMAMAVFERTAEIGLLRALGWKRARVMGLILGEALAMGLIGTAAGAALALAGNRLLMIEPTSRSFIEPGFPPAIFGIGLAMGTLLSLIGGAYPAARAAALDPTEALRHD